MSDLRNSKCVPCEGGLPAMSIIKENELLHKIPKWTIIREEIHKIFREFVFEDFTESMRFVNQVAEIAENEGHHPDIYIYYNRVKLELYTHAVGGLFINDFIIASKIDALLEKI